jgi:hypothetical protein
MENTILYNCRVYFITGDNPDFNIDLVNREFKSNGILGFTIKKEEDFSLSHLKAKVDEGTPINFIIYDFQQSDRKLLSLYQYCRHLDVLKNLAFIVLVPPHIFSENINEINDPLFFKVVKPENQLNDNHIEFIINSVEKVCRKLYPHGIQNISVDDKGNYLVINLPPEVDQLALAELEKEHGVYTQSRFNFSVLNFSKVKVFSSFTSKKIIHLFSSFGKKNSNNRFYSIEVDKDIQDQLTHDGLELGFNLHKSIEEVYKKENIKLPQNSSGNQNAKKINFLDVKAINPFIISVNNHFGTLFQSPLKLSPPQICRANPVNLNDRLFLISFKAHGKKNLIYLNFRPTVVQNLHKQFFKLTANTDPAIKFNDEIDILKTFMFDFFQESMELFSRELRKLPNHPHLEEIQYSYFEPHIGIDQYDKDGCGETSLHLNFESALGSISLLAKGTNASS